MPDRRHRLIRHALVFGPALIVLLVGVLSVVALERMMVTRRNVANTRDVIASSTLVLDALLDAETAERGWIIARDSAFLLPYYRAPARVDSLIAILKAQTHTDAAQSARVDTLAIVARERLGSIERVLADVVAGRADAAQSMVSSGEGRQLMSEVRRLVTAIEDQDERRLAVGRKDEDRDTGAVFVIIVVGALVSGMSALLVNRNFDAALADRHAALDEVSVANERLQEQAIELEAQMESVQESATEAHRAKEHAEAARLTAEESERRAERLQAATEGLSSALSLDAAARLILDQAIQALDADSGVLSAVEPSGDTIRTLATRGMPTMHVGATLSLDQETPLRVAIRTGRPIILGTAEEIRKRFPDLALIHVTEGVQAVAAIPMESNGRVLGAVVVRWNHPHSASATEASFITALSRIAADAFERGRLFDAERLARAEAEAANRAKAAFLASMSHELRTPLQAALGFAQLIRSGIYGPITDQQAEVLGRIERSQTHLAQLIDDVLDFARLEAGRTRLDMAVVAVQDVMAELTPFVEPQAAAKHIELSVSPAPQSLRVIADRHRLKQILVNLVGNAIKFTPSHGAIRVRAALDGDRAAIAVVDTGTGIPGSRLQAIFEPFVQVDDALTRTQPGTGLGLAISRDFARAMGGDITVASEVGKGSTFTVQIPLAT